MQATLIQYDAAISGAGPVGLFLSCELALAGCSVLVLERDADSHSIFKQLPFGIRGLSAPTIESLYRRSLFDELEAPRRLKNPFGGGPQATQPPRQARHFAGIGMQSERIDASRWPWRLPGCPPASLIAEMAELETVLARRAQALGVEIRRGCAVSGHTQDDDGVDVQAGALHVQARPNEDFGLGALLLRPDGIVAGAWDL